MGVIRRSMRALAAALLAVTGLAGCAIIAPNSIRVGILSEPLGLEAAYADEGSSFVGSLVHAGLYRSDASLYPQQVLASGPAIPASNGRTWTVTLRGGLTFHDGSPITGADVVFTYELAQSSRCPLASEICDLVRTRLESVEGDAAGVVTFTLQRAWSPWQTRGLTIPILPKAALEASLARLQEQIAGADRSAVSLVRENLAAQLEPGVCGAVGDPACAYAPHVAELERVLSEAGLELPDARLFPKVDASGAPTGGRDDEAYAVDLFRRLGILEGVLLAPSGDLLASAYPLLDLQLAPVGAGPFSFKQRTPGERLELSAFPGFALGEPKMRGVVLQRGESTAALIASFQASQLDWVPSLRAADVGSLQVRDGAELLKTPSLRGYYFLAFNLRAGRLFSGEATRTALASCIDPGTLIRDGTEGAGIAISSMAMPGSWAAESPAPAETTRNVSAAAAALAAAGWTKDADGVYAREGRRLEGQIVVRDGQTTRIRVAQSIADQAADCGISLAVSQESYTTQILPRLRYPNDFDLYLGGWQWGLDPDDSDILASTGCPTEEAPTGKNFVCWQNPRVDLLLARGLSATDREERAAAYAEIQQLRRSDRPYLLLWGEPGFALLSTRFSWPTRAGDASSAFYAWSIEAWGTEQP